MERRGEEGESRAKRKQAEKADEIKKNELRRGEAEGKSAEEGKRGGEESERGRGEERRGERERGEEHLAEHFLIPPSQTAQRASERVFPCHSAVERETQISAEKPLSRSGAPGMLCTIPTNE